jgi:predicted membrane metal-binding protein
MDGWNPLVTTLSRILGINPAQVVLAAALLLLVLLLFFYRNFWATFKFVLIAGALGTVAYFAYNLAAVGMERRDKLVNKPIESQDTNR